MRLKLDLQLFAKKNQNSSADFYVAPSGTTLKADEYEFYNQIKNFPNMSKQDIINSLPAGWTTKGRMPDAHLYDADGNFRGRLDPPDKVTLYDHIHLYDFFNKKTPKQNILYDIDLNKVPYNAEDGHIPTGK